MPSLRILSLPPLCGLVLASCTTMSIEEEFAEFEPKVRTAQESQQDKAMKMFGEYDPNKTSEFQGKAFTFSGKEAKLRSAFEKKEYADGDHPYFKLRKKGFFSDKKAYDTKTAREGSMIASWEGRETSWFKQIFSKKESRLGSEEVARKSFRL